MTPTGLTLAILRAAPFERIVYRSGARGKHRHLGDKGRGRTGFDEAREEVGGHAVAHPRCRAFGA